MENEKVPHTQLKKKNKTKKYNKAWVELVNTYHCGSTFKQMESSETISYIPWHALWLAVILPKIRLQDNVQFICFESVIGLVYTEQKGWNI